MSYKYKYFISFHDAEAAIIDSLISASWGCVLVSK